jgi:hypothetical protein
MAWKLTQCAWTDEAQLNALLADSWEPFAVTGSTYDNYYVWLRRSAARADAEIVRNPPRPRHEPETAR